MAKKLEPEAASTEALYPLLQLENAKTFKYIQHPKKPEEPEQTPAGVTSAAGEVGAGTGDGGATSAMTVYLTKKERKRIRRTTRLERERYVTCAQDCFLEARHDIAYIGNTSRVMS